MSRFTHLHKINYTNIGLMFVSCVFAILSPVELFLFACAILGPVHYLTEISLLHDKNYYAKGKYDHWVLTGLTLLITLPFFASFHGFGRIFPFR